MTTSVFVAESNQSHAVFMDGSPNSADNLESFLIGAGQGKFPTNFPRRSSVHAWHLESPVSGTAIPKNAIIDGVQIEVVASGVSTGVDRTDFGFAFTRPDGHWDRSREHPLHQQQGAASYGPPGPLGTMICQAYNENTASVAHTLGPARSGIVNDFVSNDEDYIQTFGSSIQIPGGEQIGSFGVELARADTPGTNPEVRVSMYSLTKNTRLHALDERIATSAPISYLDLPTTASGNELEQIFSFSPAIPAEVDTRWVAFVIEGDWFAPDNASTHRITVRFVQHQFHNFLLGDTFGSLMIASTVPAVQFENSFVGYYRNPREIPVIWESTGGSLEFGRGAPLLSWRVSDIFTFDEGDEHDEFIWIDGRPISWGNIEYGAQLSLTGDIVAGLQGYIDSVEYDPEVGRVWISIMWDREQNDGLFALWQSAGPGGSDRSPIKLIIDWHPRLINST